MVRKATLASIRIPSCARHDLRSPALATTSTHRLSCLIEFGAASLATKARVECQWRRFHTDWEGRV